MKTSPQPRVLYCLLLARRGADHSLGKLDLIENIACRWVVSDHRGFDGLEPTSAGTMDGDLVGVVTATRSAAPIRHLVGLAGG